MRPGVPEHFAVDVQQKILLPLDDVTRTRHFYHIGVGDCFIVALFDTLDDYKIISCSHVHGVCYELLYVPGSSINQKEHVILKKPKHPGWDCSLNSLLYFVL